MSLYPSSDGWKPSVETVIVETRGALPVWRSTRKARPGWRVTTEAIASLYAAICAPSAALSTSLYAGTPRTSGTLPTKIFASVRDTSADTIASRAERYVAGSIEAFMSLTASHTVTTLGRCAIAAGTCWSRACEAMEPETPRLTKAPPGGRSAATRDGQDPVAGSLAPTPTASEAPIAMYRRLVLALVGPVRGAAVVVVTGTLAVADR